MTLTYGSLFSGIGGIDLGLDRAGMACKWQVEIDDYCNRVLAKHWPNVPRHRDVRECGTRNLPAVDVIAGGFPCQGISDAGRREGLTDPRSGLWREFARIIRELRPRYVLVENVAALLYRGLGSVLGDLTALGYDAEWHCIPAAAVGAPHIRDRVYIVAYTDCPRHGGTQHEVCPGRHAAIGSRTNGRTWDVAYTASRGRREDAERLAGPRCEAGTTLALRRERAANVSDASGKGGGELAARQDQGYGAEEADPYGRGQNVPDAHCARLAQRACVFSDARSQLAAFERSCSTGPGQWATEPAICRVADGVPFGLELLGGRIDEQGNYQETNPAARFTCWQVLRAVWQHRELAKTSPYLHGERLRNIVPELPCSGGFARWVTQAETDQELCNLWQRFYALSFEEAHDLQQELLKRAWTEERRQTLAFRKQRVNRLRGLGNAVVPQVAELVGRLIVAHAQAVYGEAIR